MIANVEPLKSEFVLDDPSDPRHQYVTALKTRFGQYLHEASGSLLGQGEENTVDAVHMLVRSIRTFILEYGDSRDRYNTNPLNLGFAFNPGLLAITHRSCGTTAN